MQQVDGVEVARTFQLHVPPTYDGNGSLPLLFAYHGADGVGLDFVGQFEATVSRGEFVGVYPDGIANSWNVEREDSNADDIAFTTDILSFLDGIPGLDTARPVAVGFSNGAALLHKIAIESNVFAAIVPQASQLLVDNPPRAGGGRVSVMQFMGTADGLCPYGGGMGILGYNYMPAEASAAAWAAHNGCDATASERRVGEHLRMEWEGCAAGYRVIHYRLNGVGHGVPPNVDGGTEARIVEFLSEARGGS